MGSDMGPDLMNPSIGDMREWTLNEMKQLVESINKDVSHSAIATHSLRIVNSLHADGECRSQTFVKKEDGDWIVRK